jgi:AAA15 family ATPase/GTPase
MIKQFSLENFGPLASIKAENLGKLNLVMGTNSTGKTFLLKALYALIRSQEEYGRGNDPRTFDEILSDKLYWTFQTEKLGDLVRKGKDYEQFFKEIQLKIQHSLILWFAIVCGRHNKLAVLLPVNLKSPLHLKLPIKIFLVIPTVPNEFLALLTHKLRNILKAEKKAGSLKMNIYLL